MSKSVEYEIKLLNSAANAATIKQMRDSIAGLKRDVDAQMAGLRGPSIAAIGSALPDYRNQVEQISKLGDSLDRTSAKALSLADDMRHLGEEAAKSGDELGRKMAKSVKTSMTEELGRLGGLNDDDLKTLLKADDNATYQLGADAADKFREGMRSRLSDDLGLKGDDADFLFGAKGGDGLSGQQDDFRKMQNDSQQSIRNLMGEYDQLDAKGRDVTKSLSGNFREMAEKTEAAASGIGQMASGLSFLFADSENAKQLIDTLLLIKGTSDIVLGGFKAFSGATQVFSLAKDRTQLLGESQQVQAQKTRALQNATAEYVDWLQREGIALERVTRGNKEHADALMQVASAARRAQAANRDAAGSRGLDGGLGSDLAQRASSSRGRGRGGFLRRAGGSIAGLAGYAGANYLGQATGDSSGIVEGIADVGIDAGMDKLGNAQNAAKAGKFAKLAGSIGSIIALGKIGYDSYVNTQTPGQIKPDSMSGKFFGAIGTNRTLGKIDQTLGLDTAGSRLAKSYDELDKAIEKRKKVEEKLAQDELNAALKRIERQAQAEVTEFQRGARETVRGLAVDNGDLGASVAARQREAEAAKDLQASLRQISNYQNGILLDQSQYEDAIESSKAAYERLVDAQKQIISGVREEANERKRINSESISAAEARISLLEKERGIFRTNSEKLEDAAAKFARLSAEDKQGVIKAQEVAASGGRLNVKQRQLLEGIGLGAESEVVRRQDLADARKAGFFQRFGGFEQSQLAGSRERLNELGQLQQLGAGIAGNGNIREREAQLRELNRRQESLGQRQDAAADRRGFGQRTGEAAFDAQRQEMRLDIQTRRDINVKIEADTQAIAKLLRGEIQRALATQEEIVRKVALEAATVQKAEATNSQRVKTMAARNSR